MVHTGVLVSKRQVTRAFLEGFGFNCLFIVIEQKFRRELRVSVLLQVVTLKTTQSVWQESVIVGLGASFAYVMRINILTRYLDVS